ncbi:Gfo/Idh/MocA family oxidoreductase [Synechococcus sp. YX-04-1]|uniref:Gfo/Idh/MocA family protein n=1 Tax=Synechococcus sp. YX-04-1 TaxID=3062778 RepID=UPI0026E208D1|nr:Gfo/Idh/MocA family oxidoreductase [Synechococcus sp. YX-04-1]MDO6351102.1 Gfo/Idh/MocA family oxidoreductase [Synechococcus sp. YX-04-1]
MGSTSALRVAFVGAGYMASEHIYAFASCPDVELVGIHSRSTHRAEALSTLNPGLEVFPTIESLHSQTNADLVVIAVPELACQTICEQAFKHPWTLLIEKPVGYTLTQARQIERTAAALGAKAYVALNRRFYGSTLQLQNALQSTEGQRVVTILDQEDAESALAAGQPAEVVHNWMYANSIHLIDYFAQLCRGDHIGTEILTPWKPNKPGPVIAHLQFSSGDIGLYQAVWNAPGPWSVAVSTTPLRAELRPIEQLNLQRAGSRQPELQARDPLDQQFKPGLLRQAQAAIQAAKGQSTMLPSLKEANRSMALVASIYGME